MTPTLDYTTMTHAESMAAWQLSLGVPLTYETSRGTVNVRFVSSYRGETDFGLTRRGVALGRLRNLVDDRFAPGRAGQWVTTVDGTHYGASAVDALAAATAAGAL